MARFPQTYCSQCGGEFGPGDEGYSHCNDHQARPSESEILGMAEDYGQWMWDAGYLDDPRGEKLVDEAAFKREEIKQALQKLVQHVYAEGRKDERENLERIGAVSDCQSCGGRGEQMATFINGPDAYQEVVDCHDCQGTGYANWRSAGLRKLWLWKNFVNGKPEYWAFDNPYPINLTDGDPQTLGEPCGYAIFKQSRNGRPEVREEQVLRAIAIAQTKSSPTP